jgi:acetyl esterase/lipase
MTLHLSRNSVFLFALLLIGSLAARGQAVNSWTITSVNDYRVVPNITYSVASNYECKLDVYAPRKFTMPVPTVLLIHGGGWVAGTKEGAIMMALPYLEMGLAVVNVEYRLAKTALAPAAVEDCRLALRWVFKNAKEYGFDTTKIVVTGGSAGGHLALMTGMLDPSGGFDMPKDWDYSGVQPEVAAIVNWYGITDVKDLLTGPNKQNYAVFWIGNQLNKDDIAQRVSPLSYVRKDLPPILSIHGDKDGLVPYEHAVRLHAKLSSVGVRNQLITVPGGNHGGFSKEEMARIFPAIREFLKNNGIL